MKMLSRRQLDAIRNSACGKCGAIPPLNDGSRCHPHRLIAAKDGGQYTEDNVAPRCPGCHATEHNAPLIKASLEGGRKGGRVGGPARADRLTREELSAIGRKAGHASYYGSRTPEERSEFARSGGLAVAAKRRTLGLNAFWQMPAQAAAAGRKGGPAAIAKRVAAGLDAFCRTREKAAEDGRRTGRLGGLVGARNQPREAKVLGARNQPREAKARGGYVTTHRRWHLERGIANPRCPICVAEGAS